MKYKFVNGNPWQRLDRPDCTIRSLSLALNMSYIEVCRKLQVKCELGYGLAKDEGACTVNKIINNFKSFFNAIEIDEIYDKAMNGSLEDDGNMDVEAGFTIEEQAEMLPKGIYLFFLRPTKEERKHGMLEQHTTVVNTATMTLYDTFNCLDENNVLGYIQINMSKRLDPDDPKSRLVEWKKIDKGMLWGTRIPQYIQDKEKWKKLQDYIASPNFDEKKLKGGILSWIQNIQKQRGLQNR